MEGQITDGQGNSTTTNYGIVTDSRIFDTHIVTKLNGNDVKFFYDVNRESRAAIQRSGAQVPYAFEIGDFETTSTYILGFKEVY